MSLSGTGRTGSVVLGVQDEIDTPGGGGSIVTCRLEDVSRGNGFLTNAGVFLVVIATVLAQVLYDKHGIEGHITAYPDNYCPQRIKAQFSSVGKNPVVSNPRNDRMSVWYVLSDQGRVRWSDLVVVCFCRFGILHCGFVVLLAPRSWLREQS